MNKFLIVLLVSVFCSVQGASFIPRVVNGTDAEISDYPYIISLRNSGSHFCGGSIIHPLWGLTAAHCAQRNTKYVTALHSTTKLPGDPNHSVGVEKFIVHEKYDTWYLANDISLIKFEEEIISPFTNFLSKLPNADAQFETGTPSVLVGWGLNGVTGSVQTTLQKADLQIYNWKDCAEIHYNPVYETNICGGVPGGYKGQCNGDSGGPMTVDGVQVGIVSWSVKPCTVPPYPGVYTATAPYIGWISENTGLEF